MASKKSRILKTLQAALAEYTNEDLMNSIHQRLREMGAPENLVRAALVRKYAMRADLPRAIEFVEINAKSSDSIETIFTALAHAGFSSEILMLAWSPLK